MGYNYDRKQALKVSDVLSPFVSVISGVPQSSVLGPSLFLIFINDVSDIFCDLSVVCKLYADDIKLYTSYCLSQSPNDLMKAIDRLTSWADTWQFEVGAK